MWTAVCEECEHDWEPVEEGQEPPEHCPLCSSTEILVEVSDPEGGTPSE